MENSMGTSQLHFPLSLKGNACGTDHCPLLSVYQRSELLLDTGLLAGSPLGPHFWNQQTLTGTQKISHAVSSPGRSSLCVSSHYQGQPLSTWLSLCDTQLALEQNQDAIPRISSPFQTQQLQIFAITGISSWYHSGSLFRNINALSVQRWLFSY